MLTDCFLFQAPSCPSVLYQWIFGMLRFLKSAGDFQHVKLAKKFYDLAKNDSRFEVVGKPMMGLVCFRLKLSKLVIRFICFGFKAKKLRFHEFVLLLFSVNDQTPLYHFSGANSEQQEREERTRLPGYVVHPGQSDCNYLIQRFSLNAIKGLYLIATTSQNMQI